MVTCKGRKKDGAPCGSPIVLENGYCRAHQGQAGEVKTEEEPERWTRERLEAAIAEHGGPEGLDLAGTALSNLDLEEMDLHGIVLCHWDKESRTRVVANLQGAKLWSANLQGAFLRGINLRRADLWDAKLQKANLRDADLQEASLEHANLQEAALLVANLQEAILMGANLRKARLESANLRGAKLGGANLQETNLTGARLQEADLEDADLRGASCEGVNLLKLRYSSFQ